MQQPQPFTHIPCAADVPSNPEHASQRYFSGLSGKDREVKATGKLYRDYDSVAVWLYRPSEKDSAQLNLEVIQTHGRSITSANLTPAELRDLAQRLLDAAHDIEAHPAAVLACAQHAAEEVAA